MKEFRAIRGTRDFYGADAQKFEYIFETFRKKFEVYGYSRIIVPLIESTDLFIRSVGESSDIVNKEMYTFEDRGGRSITLIPEVTASVVRTYIEHKIWNLNKSDLFKSYYISPAFRYERPQLGRYRQFYQLGAEVLGEDSIYTDIEMLQMIIKMFNDLNIDIRLEMNFLPEKSNRKNYENALKDFLNPRMGEMCSDCNVRIEKNPLRILDCKNENCSKILEHAPSITDFLSEIEKERFDSIRKNIGIETIVRKSLVRGLDYYTGLVFEFYAKNDKQGAILAGGRYDNMVEEFGGPKTSAIGFSAGVERLINIVELPSSFRPLIFLAYTDENFLKDALYFANILRDYGLEVRIELKPKKFKKQLQIAESLNCRYLIILGEDEIKTSLFTLKNMDSREQQKLTLEELKKYFSVSSYEQ